MIERECGDGCGYEVSSMSAGSGTAARTFPTECPRCGADLVRAGSAGDDDHDETGLSAEKRQQIKEDPVLDLSDIDEETGELMTDGGTDTLAGLVGRSTPDASGSPIVQTRIPVDPSVNRGCEHSDDGLPCFECFTERSDR